MVHVPRLHRSLAAPGFAVVRLVQWAMAAVVAGSVLVAAWLWWDSRALEERAERYEASAGRIQDANRKFLVESLREGFDLSEARTKTLAQEITFSKQVAEQDTFSWTQLLSALEETVPPHVSINSVGLAPKSALISLSGSALSLADITAFVATLESHRSFRNVVLSQYRVQEPGKERKSPVPSRPFVEFTLSVSYRSPAGPSPQPSP